MKCAVLCAVFAVSFAVIAAGPVVDEHQTAHVNSVSWYLHFSGVFNCFSLTLYINENNHESCRANDQLLIPLCICIMLALSVNNCAMFTLHNCVRCCINLLSNNFRAFCDELRQ